MPCTSVCARKNGPEQVKPITANSAAQSANSTMPVFATRSAMSCRFSPSEREISALTPSPVPAPRPIISDWSGNANDSALNASCETRETK